MTTAKPAEKTSRRRRSIPGMLIALIFNSVLMGLLVWFLLLIGFGCYRLAHPAQAVYENLKAITNPNVIFLQQSRLFHRENQRLQDWIQGINEQIQSNRETILLNGKIKEMKHQFPDLQKIIGNQWNKIKQEVLPLIAGVTTIVITRILALCLSIPLFFLCVALGFVDGLAQRDIRRFQVARESALLFHELKRSSAFWFYLPLFFYLLLPYPLSPQWFLVPMAITLGVLVQLSTKSFKKYV